MDSVTLRYGFKGRTLSFFTEGRGRVCFTFMWKTDVSCEVDTESGCYC